MRPTRAFAIAPFGSAEASPALRKEQIRGELWRHLQRSRQTLRLSRAFVSRAVDKRVCGFVPFCSRRRLTYSLRGQLVGLRACFFAVNLRACDSFYGLAALSWRRCGRARFASNKMRVTIYDYGWRVSRPVRPVHLCDVIGQKSRDNFRGCGKLTGRSCAPDAV